MAVSGRTAPQTFFSTTPRGSSEDFEIFCQPCDRDDVRLPAFGFCVECEEHLCDSCFNHHKRAKPSMHHTLLDKHSMPQALLVPSRSIFYGLPFDLTKQCSLHQKEMIEFYCNDHNTLLCSVCVTLKHPSTACHVDPMPDLSGKIVNCKEYKELLEKINTMLVTLKDTGAVLRKIVEKSNVSLEDCLAEIKRFRHEVDQRLGLLEYEIKAAVQSLKHFNHESLPVAEKTIDDITTGLQKSSDVIKELNASKRANKLFLELRAAEKLIKLNEYKISQLITSTKVKKYHFQPNIEISTLLNQEHCLGMLIKTTIKPEKYYPVTLKPRQLLHQSEAIVKTPEDREESSITGMTLLTPDTLVIADSNNMSVKMINIKCHSIIDQLTLKAVPWDVTIVSKNKIAVTLPYAQAIQCVSVSSNKLERSETVKVAGKCYCVHCYQRKLVVSFHCPAKLQIIDLKGSVLSTITTNRNGDDIFEEPYNVTANSSFIYVSEKAKKAIIMLNWEGEVEGTFDGLRTPGGLAMLEDGSFFLSDRHSFAIKNISGDCTKSQVVLNGSSKGTSAMCWCEANSTLYASSLATGSARDFIQIYKMS